MGYNKINYLKKIIEIQTITMEYKNKGTFQEWIYINVIAPRFYISRATFYNYLAINAKKELKKLETEQM